MDSLSTIYYGNSLKQWLISGGIILGSLIAGKMLYWLFNRVFKQLTKKTETKLDDIIVDMIEEPIVAILVIIGSWYAIDLLTFTEAVGNFIDKSLGAAITLTVTWLIIRLIDAIIEEYVVPLTEKTETDFDDQILPIARRGFKGVAWIIGIIVALNNAGFDVMALIAGLGIGGLALAMAAKDTVSNFFGSLTVFVDQPFKINDRIVIAGYDGFIDEIGLRSTRLRTLEGRTVTIPNAKFTDGIVENISSEPSRKVSLKLGLTYDMDAQKVSEAMNLLKEINAGNSNTEDRTIIGFTEFGDFALGILFIYYIKPGEDIIQTQTNINLEILEKFASKGLEFAFPTQTIHSITS
ncbi:MAG: mechanosensitive ion channel family protein [Flavobacteriales bacterium]|nr:mechanosensitive ion channel family protein [Flavobacteriales bacterium]